MTFDQLINAVAVALAPTRAASPGPGTMTAVGSPGVSQVVSGKNALLLTRNPSNAGGGTTAVRYDGVPAGAGLTMIVRVIPAMTGRYAPEFYGFSLSSAAIESNSAGSFFISNGGGGRQPPLCAEPARFARHLNLHQVSRTAVAW